MNEKEKKVLEEEEDIDLLLAQYGIVLDDEALEEPPEEPDATEAEDGQPQEPVPVRRRRGQPSAQRVWLHTVAQHCRESLEAGKARREEARAARAAERAAQEEARREEAQRQAAEEQQKAADPPRGNPAEGRPDASPASPGEEPFTVADVVASTVDSVLEERKEDERRFQKQRRKEKKKQERIHRSNAQRAADVVEFPEEEPSLAEAAVRQKHRYLRMKKHAAVATVLTLLCWVPIVLEGVGIAIPGYSDQPQIFVLVSALLQLLVCIAAWPVYVLGFTRLPLSGHTCAALVSLLTLADTCGILLLPQRLDVPPLGAISAVALCLCLWGECWHAGALREGFRLVALGNPSYVVDLTENGALKQRGNAAGFYHRAVKEDAVSRWQGLLLPVILVGSVVFGVLSSFGLSRPQNFLWCWSAILTAGTALALPCVYSMPYYRLAKRLGKSGCAVAGLYGARQLSYSREMLVNDADLFPPGSIRVREVKVIGEERRKVAAYAGSLAEAYGCGWTDLFTAFLQETGARRERLDHFHVHDEGGISAAIHGETAVLGTASLLRRMSIHLPKTLEWKDGLYLAIDGELSAIFCLVYQPADSVRWALGAMHRNGLTPLLAVRDPNLTLRFLKRIFSTDGGALMLDLNERLNLSLLREEGDARPNGLLYREGLAPYFDVVAGSKRLCHAVRWGNAITLLGSVAGTLLGFYLVFMGSADVLTPLQLLLFLGLWLLPVLVLTWNVDQI